MVPPGPLPGRREGPLVRQAAQLGLPGLGGRGRVVRGEMPGQPDQGGQPLRRAGTQLDPDPVPRGETGHGVEAHVPGDGDVDHGRVVQPPVHVREPVGGDAHAVVAHLDEHAAAVQLHDRHADLGALRREQGGVLDELGEQVHDVGRRLPGDHDPRLDRERHPVVLLDLGGSGASHVGEGDGLGPLADRFLAREHEQVLRVPPHPGDHVVHGEEVGELVRVVLALLHRVDHAGQPLDQRHRAPGQADEHRVQAAAQLRLGAREAHGLGVHLVERAGHPADLVGGPYADRLDLGRGLRGVRAGGGGRYPLGQPLRRDLERVRLEPAQRVDEGAADQGGREQHEDHCAGGDCGRQDRGVDRLLLQRLSARHGLGRDPRLDRAELADHRRAVGVPGSRQRCLVEAVRLVAVDRLEQHLRILVQRHGADDGLHLVVLLAAHGRRVRVGLVRGGGVLEVRYVGVLQAKRRGEGGDTA